MSAEKKPVKPKRADGQLPFNLHFSVAVGSSPGAIWCTSNDHDETLNIIKLACKGPDPANPRDWMLWSWSAASGLSGIIDIKPIKSIKIDGDDHFNIGLTPEEKARQMMARCDAVTSIKMLQSHDNACPLNKRDRITMILVLQDLDLCWEDPVEKPRIISAIRQFIQVGKINRKVIVGLSHIGAQVHEKLQPLFTLVPHGLPNEDELRSILEERIKQPMEGATDRTLPTVEEQRDILKSGKGLTRLQFDNAVCESMARYKGAIKPDYLWNFKVELYNQEGLVEVHRGKTGFDAIAGQVGLKAIGKQIAGYMLRKPGIRTVEGIEPKGILLVGPPGTGKTMFATCLGYETGLHTLVFDMGKLFGKWLGESESKMDRALAMFEAHAPAIIVIDELGRMVNSDRPSGKGDEGSATESRVTAKFLTWLSSPKRNGLFIIGTTNDATGIQTLCRPGRFDMSIYVPLEMPDKHKDTIWNIYMDRCQLPSKSLKRPPDKRLTPAEIEQVCVNSLILGDIPLVEAIDTINQIGETKAAEMAELDEWGRRFLISSETGRRFGVGEEEKPAKRTRRNITVIDDDGE